MALQFAKWGRQTFASLGVRNYRLYFVGQMISQAGTFMQQVAQAWLVLKLTNSGTALGLIAALQSLPVLFFAPLGGILADRFPKRTVLLLTQAGFGLLALLLGALVIADKAQLWMVAALAFAFGLINCVDNPTRQAFVVEMVGPSQLRNAVSLNSTMFNVSRIIGPALAGVLIAAVGMAPCFITNGLSYSAVIVTLLAMQVAELHADVRQSRGRPRLAEGFRYAFSTPLLRDILIIMAIIGTLTYEFQVSLPLLAQFTFQGNASSYAALTSALGIGSVMGGLVTASGKSTSFRTLVVAALLFGLTALLTASMPTLRLAIAACILLGFCSIYFSSTGNTTIQLASDPQMRGRVMALWSMAVLGSTAIGAPVIGFIGQHAGARWGLATGGIAAVFAAAYGFRAHRRGVGPGKV
jgi:MFS family permease